jgi:hypothetical protein
LPAGLFADILRNNLNPAWTPRARKGSGLSLTPGSLEFAASKINGVMEVFSYIAIAVIFLSGIIPVILGIIQSIKENRDLDKANRARMEK